MSLLCSKFKFTVLHAKYRFLRAGYTIRFIDGSVHVIKKHTVRDSVYACMPNGHCPYSFIFRHLSDGF